MASLKKYLALDRETLSAAGRASTIGLHMISGVAVGCGLGWLLDRLLGTRPWLLLLFFALGVAAGFRNVWLDTRLVMRAQERADRERANLEQADRERRTEKEKDAGGSGPPGNAGGKT